MSRTVKKQTISHSNNAEVKPFQIKSAKVVKSLCDLSVGSCTKQSFVWDVSKQSISICTRKIRELNCSKQLSLHVSPRFSVTYLQNFSFDWESQTQSVPSGLQPICHQSTFASKQTI